MASSLKQNFVPLYGAASERTEEFIYDIKSK
jgi:hypothetical protein